MTVGPGGSWKTPRQEAGVTSRQSGELGKGVTVPSLGSQAAWDLEEWNVRSRPTVVHGDGACSIDRCGSPGKQTPRTGLDQGICGGGLVKRVLKGRETSGCSAIRACDEGGRWGRRVSESSTAQGRAGLSWSELGAAGWWGTGLARVRPGSVLSTEKKEERLGRADGDS